LPIFGDTILESKLVSPILILFVLTCYHSAFSAEFIWDDEILVNSRAVSDPYGLLQIWFEPARLRLEPHYWPLTYSTFWLEHKLWGFDPTGYHVVNVLLHGVNTLLLFRLLVRLDVPGAALAAALFAVHPMQAEAVTWIMGRKDLLSTLFYLAAADCWLRNRHRPRLGAQMSAILLFAAGMFAKSMTITLPAALLVCVWWKDGRITMADVRRVAPLFVVGAGIAAIDLIHYTAHAELGGIRHSWPERLLIAFRALWFYGLRILWPHPLPVIYPHWDSGLHDLRNWLCLLASIASVAALWLLRGRLGRGPLAGALFFAITLSPVLGFANNSYMEYSFVADRYQYLAGVGIKALVAGALARGLATVGRLRALVTARLVALALVGACAVLTMRHALVFQNQIALFSHVVSLNPTARGAQYNLGLGLISAGRPEDGIEVSRRALELDPNGAKAHGSIGWALMTLQRYEEAEESLRRAVKVNATDVQARQNLAESLRLRGRFEEALPWYDATIALDGEFAHGHAGRALTLAELDRWDEARESFRRALAADAELASLLADAPAFRRAMGSEGR